MPRATLCAFTDVQSEVDALYAWIDKWKDFLSHLSGNQGCGCCVDMYDVEGPAEAIDDIPSTLLCGSEWAGVQGRSDAGEGGECHTT
jgi:hypothetical protein